MPTKQHRIVLISMALGLAKWRETPIGRVFFAELHRLGHAEGDNLVVEAISADGDPERFTDAARQAVSRNPDVIVAADNVNALRPATSTIAIVAVMGDPLNMGLVTSLALRPGDNLTGVSMEPGVEIWGKRLQILKQAIPSAPRVGILGTRGMRESPSPNQLDVLRDAGAALGVSLIEMTLSEVNAPEIEHAFAALAEQRADAVIIRPGLAAHTQLVVRLAERYRLPAMYPTQIYADAGGLMTYAPDVADLGRQLADDVHRILDGAKPGDIPIYQATKFKLVINLKTANGLGLTLPRSLLLLADEVIE
jgi:putative tryptophan/tyrosine transport system substrate-binding protein